MAYSSVRSNYEVLSLYCTKYLFSLNLKCNNSKLNTSDETKKLSLIVYETKINFGNWGLMIFPTLLLCGIQNEQ